ncbi:aminotransferase [Sphingomonas sp. BN140010]|uniref:Aminotransferase n=1 Tax=Sphingomonas arvum TaxID=2992113 RepID=A0ABT3JES3_9SPHN|nr:aminotransferase [Sphingomonas sp. BN140010]MCW3797571.1 aminotransferase [Sphingomonas sp. BN140010]
MNPLYADMPLSIFERMSMAAIRHGAVNLGQGFPDFGWPEPLVEEAARLLREGSNQYPPSRGLPVLREAVAAHYNRCHGLQLTADHVLVTSGATEAIAAAILAVIGPGEEAIVIAPAYDAYAPLVRRAGGTVREVALRAPDWQIDEAALRAAVTDRSRLLILNNPHNPTGRLFSRAELEAVASIAREHDLLVLSDEVWEHVLLDGAAFTSLAVLPGMAERTLKCGSAGKIFSLTGWKVGWLVAPPAFAGVVAKAHQFLTFATPPNLQAAVAVGLAHHEWLTPMRAAFTRARNRLVHGLEQAGYAVLPAQATYFQCVDLAQSGIDMTDIEFATLAVERAGVAVIPLSPFFEAEPVTTMVRLCFAKQDSTIDAGLQALAKARALAC